MPLPLMLNLSSMSYSVYAATPNVIVEGDAEVWEEPLESARTGATRIAKDLSKEQAIQFAKDYAKVLKVGTWIIEVRNVEGEVVWAREHETRWT